MIWHCLFAATMDWVDARQFDSATNTRTVTYMPVTVGTGLVTSAQEKTAIRELLLMSRSTFAVWLDCRQPQVINLSNVWLDPVVAGANLE